MSTKPALTPKAAAHLGNMIERTERRGAILTDLVDVCVTLSKKLARDMLDGPFHPESRHDTARAFDVVTRSLRLTLAMEDRVDAQLFALHNGEPPVAPAPKAARASAPEPSPEPEADREEAADKDRRESETERLVEYDRFDLTDIDANVEAIQADLGRLAPSPEVGRVDSAKPSGVGTCGSSATLGVTAHFPNPDFASLRLDPPHFGKGRVPDSDGDDLDKSPDRSPVSSP